jgi:hypothetical protein
LPGVGVLGRERLAFSILNVLPSNISPWRPSFAASACSAVTIFTKPNPRDSLVCGSSIMAHFSTSPYFSKRRVTSSSERRGWMPVTKRLEPGLRAEASLSSPWRLSCIGGLREAHSRISGGQRWGMQPRRWEEKALPIIDASIWGCAAGSCTTRAIASRRPGRGTPLTIVTDFV